MPKLLQKSLWEWTFKVAMFAIIMASVWFVISQFIESFTYELYFSLAGAICIPYALFIFSNSSLPVVNEYIYIAPFSCRQRKNLLRTYFWRQCLLGCILSLSWSIFIGYIVPGSELFPHPAKAAFVAMTQFCLIFELLFISYYRPRLRLSVMVLILLTMGSPLQSTSLKEPAMSVSDYIVMIILGSVHAATVLVIRIKYFDKMLTSHSRYETSRNIPRGFR